MAATQLVVVAVCVVIPDMHIVIDQIFDVGIALQKPQQLVDNTSQKDTLGGKQREALVQIESHLVTKHALCSRSCAVTLDRTLGGNAFQKVEILFHTE